MKTMLPGRIEYKEPKNAVAKTPEKYQVLVLNDDYTPMGFVVEALEKFFFLTENEAVQLMWEIHKTGKVGIGCFTQDIAETKAAQLMSCARQSEYPLCCWAEKIVLADG